MSKKRGKISAKIAIIITMVILGLTFTVTKVALNYFGPFTIAFLRFVIASAFFIPIILIRSNRQLPLLELSIMGVIVTMFYILQNMALVYTTSVQVSLILAFIPAATAILSFFFLKEKTSLLQSIAILISIVGVAIMILTDPSAILSLNLGKNLLGNLLVFGAVLSWSLYTIVGRHLNLQFPPLLISAYSICITTILLVPFVVGEYYTNNFIITASTEGFLPIFFLGIASFTIFSLYNYSLTVLRASETAIYTNIPPIVAVIAGVTFLSEEFGFMHFIGGFFIVLGIYIYYSRLPQIKIKH